MDTLYFELFQRHNARISGLTQSLLYAFYYAGYVCNAMSEVLMAIIVKMTFLVRDTVYCVRHLPTFQRNDLFASYILQMEGTGSSEMSVSF
jgi:hypothetical protein